MNRKCARCGISDETVLDLDTGSPCHPEPIDCIRILLEINNKLALSCRTTKDGVPITDNMRVYFKHPELNEIWDWRVPVMIGTKFVQSVHDSDDSWQIEATNCYSSRDVVENFYVPLASKTTR